MMRRLSNIFKYGIDPKSGGISVDRKLFPAFFYPCNYGFIPQTKEEGGDDPIDVFILGNSSLLPKSVISCRPVGILLTEDPNYQNGHPYTSDQIDEQNYLISTITFL